MFYLTTLLIAKLIGAQCHWFMNEIRVWSSGRMTVTRESGVRNPTIRDTAHEDINVFLLASRAQLTVRALKIISETSIPYKLL
jgi:hypothetical protein